MSEKPHRRASGRRARHEIPAWEWMIGALGALILLGTIGFFVAQAFNPAGPPRLTVTLDSVVQHDAQYAVMFRLTNEGRTVADVAIEGVLEQNGNVVDRAHVLIPFAPNKTRVNAAVVFTRDPRAGQVRIMVRGFTDP